VKILVLAIVIIGAAAGATPPDGCAMLPLDQIRPLLGITKNTPVKTAKLPPKATEANACTYSGQEHVGLVVRFKFDSPDGAREYLEYLRGGLTKKSIRTTSEKFDGEDGFSSINGMVAVKKNMLIRVKVGPPSTSGNMLADPALTRLILLMALKAN
jgi:hypothetical protein